MKLKTKELIEFLQNKKDDLEWYLFNASTKQWKTEAQKRTFELLFWIISKYNWYHRDAIKIFFLTWCFWQRPIIMGKDKIMVPIVWSTMWLTKEQWILLIDTILEFIKINNIWFTLNTREIQSLYDTFN